MRRTPIGAWQEPRSRCGGWITYNGSGTIAIDDSYNVASITDNGAAGDVTVTWQIPFANGNYAVVGMSIEDGSANGAFASLELSGGARSASAVRIVTEIAGSNAAIDATQVCVIAFGQR